MLYFETFLAVMWHLRFMICHRFKKYVPLTQFRDIKCQCYIFNHFSRWACQFAQKVHVGWSFSPLHVAQLKNCFKDGSYWNVCKWIFDSTKYQNYVNSVNNSVKYSVCWFSNKSLVSKDPMCAFCFILNHLHCTGASKSHFPTKFREI